MMLYTHVQFTMLSAQAYEPAPYAVDVGASVGHALFDAAQDEEPHEDWTETHKTANAKKRRSIASHG